MKGLKVKEREPISEEIARLLLKEEVVVPENISDVIAPVLNDDFNIESYRNLMTGTQGRLDEVVRKGKHFIIFHPMYDGELYADDLDATVGVLAVRSKVTDALIIAVFKMAKKENGTYGWEEIKDDAKTTGESVRSFVSSRYLIDSHPIGKNLECAHHAFDRFDICGQTNIGPDLSDTPDTGCSFCGFTKVLFDYFGGPVCLYKENCGLVLKGGMDIVDNLTTKEGFCIVDGIYETGNVPVLDDLPDDILRGMKERVLKELMPDPVVSFMEKTDIGAVQRVFQSVTFFDEGGRPYVELFELERLGAGHDHNSLRLAPRLIFSDKGGSLCCRGQ